MLTKEPSNLDGLKIRFYLAVWIRLKRVDPIWKKPAELVQFQEEPQDNRRLRLEGGKNKQSCLGRQSYSFPGSAIASDNSDYVHSEKKKITDHFSLDTERSLLMIVTSHQLDYRIFGPEHNSHLIRVGGVKLRVAVQNTNVKFSLRLKKKTQYSSWTQWMRRGSLAASIDFFPGTNYPDVRDLTHKLWTAGEFSRPNHTSVRLASNNPQCLTALRPPHPGYVLITSQRRLLAVGPSPRAPSRKTSRCCREKRVRDWWFPHETTITCFLSDISLLLSKGWNERIICHERQMIPHLVAAFDSANLKHPSLKN